MIRKLISGMFVNKNMSLIHIIIHDTEEIIIFKQFVGISPVVTLINDMKSLF